MNVIFFFKKIDNDFNLFLMYLLMQLHESFKPLFDRMSEWFASEAEALNDHMLIDVQLSFEQLRTNGFK